MVILGRCNALCYQFTVWKTFRIFLGVSIVLWIGLILRKLSRKDVALLQHRQDEQDISLMEFIGNVNDSNRIIKIFYNLNTSWWEPTNFSLCDGYKRCELISSDYSRTKECSAVLINNAAKLPKHLPKRWRHQIWVLVSHEPPGIENIVYKDEMWRYQFNWTMTYRMDSTFPFPWGYIVPSKHSQEADFEEIYLRKSGSIAWIVSNCKTQSRREEYVKTLAKYIKVDLFGKCNNVTCKLSDGFFDPNDECRNRISAKYKFYLSFENSLCKYYTTEKLYAFYKYRRHIIPIVRGSPDIKYLLPENTYINAGDFANAHELGKYLTHLSNDKERYIAMLRAKDAVDAETQAYTFKRAMCSVCDTLHKHPIPKPSRFDLKEWNDNAGCNKPIDLD